MDSDEAFLQRSPIDVPNSHLRLKTALLRARAVAALMRTGVVSIGASFMLTRGLWVGPGGLPTRRALDGVVWIASSPLPRPGPPGSPPLVVQTGTGAIRAASLAASCSAGEISTLSSRRAPLLLPLRGGRVSSLLLAFLWPLGEVAVSLRLLFRC